MEVQRRQCCNPEYDPEAYPGTCCVTLSLAAGFLATLIMIFIYFTFGYQWPTVHVAFLSLSLSSTPSPPAISGNWSVALSVKNPMRLRRFGWDHAQVLLFYHDEFVAGTFLKRLSVAPRRNVTLETGAVGFSLEVGDRAARAMVMDREDGGVLELEVRFLRHDDGLPYESGWDIFDCHGLKVRFSSQNQSQVGLLLSGSPHQCI